MSVSRRLFEVLLNNMSGHGSRDPEALSDHDLCGWRPANHSHWLAARLSDPQTWYRLSVQQREVCCIMSCLERFDHDIPVSSNLPHRLRTQPCSHKLDTIYPVRSIMWDFCIFCMRRISFNLHSIYYLLRVAWMEVILMSFECWWIYFYYITGCI